MSLDNHHRKMLDTITTDKAVARQDLVELLDNIADLGTEVAVSDFYNSNGYPVIKDEDEDYERFRDDDTQISIEDK